MDLAQRIKQILTNVLEVKEDEITDSFGPGDADLWDSMNNLHLITALEEEFQIHLTMDEIRQMDTFGRIKEIVERRASA